MIYEMQVTGLPTKLLHFTLLAKRKDVLFPGGFFLAATLIQIFASAWGVQSWAQ